jgi:hypothetical protein
MFFPNMIDSFFIRENELESYSFKQVLEIKKLMWKCLKKHLIMIV